MPKFVFRKYLFYTKHKVKIFILRRFPSEPPPQGTHGSTSPQLLISRFAHQLKQESPPSSLTMPPQQGAGSKESAKKRFASYVRLRLGSERAPSPEPPPRFNRGESPLALRKNLIDQESPTCTPRRYAFSFIQKMIYNY